MCNCEGANSSDHHVIYKGEGNETLCFQCAVRKAYNGEFIETEIEHTNSWQICSECNR